MVAFVSPHFDNIKDKINIYYHVDNIKDNNIILKKPLQSSKPAKAARNDSARVRGQDRQIPPALGTNQIAGFRGFRLLASL